MFSKIWRVFFLILPLFLLLWGMSAYAEERKSISPRVEQIDQRIKELEDMKRGYESRAIRHEDQADRLQFDDQTYLETRRHNQLAAENRAKAAAVQQEIDRLKEERSKLVK